MPENIEKIVESCFHPKEGRPNLHKVPVNTKYMQQHMDKAHGNLHGVEIVTNDDAEWIIEDAKDFVLKIEEVLA